MPAVARDLKEHSWCYLRQSLCHEPYIAHRCAASCSAAQSVQKQHREEDTAHAGSSDEASLKRNRTVITCLMILINNPYSVMSKASFDEASRGGQSSSSREQQMNDPRYVSRVVRPLPAVWCAEQSPVPQSARPLPPAARSRPLPPAPPTRWPDPTPTPAARRLCAPQAPPVRLGVHPHCVPAAWRRSSALTACPSPLAGTATAGRGVPAPRPHPASASPQTTPPPPNRTRPCPRRVNSRGHDEALPRDRATPSPWSS